MDVSHLGMSGLKPKHKIAMAFMLCVRAGVAQSQPVDHADHPPALLERGILHRLAGNTDQARKDWIAVITLAQGLPVAEEARANIERLDQPP